MHTTHTHTHTHVLLLSDGVGRTGTFICIHSQLERLKTEGVVDIFQSIKSARIQRAGLVPEVVRNWLSCCLYAYSWYKYLLLDYTV